MKDFMTQDEDQELSPFAELLWSIVTKSIKTDRLKKLEALDESIDRANNKLYGENKENGER